MEASITPILASLKSEIGEIDLDQLVLSYDLSRVVPEHPRMLDALDIAELRGITLEEVAQIRRETAKNQKCAIIDEVIAEFPPFDTAAN